MDRTGFFVLCAFLWAGKGHDFRVGGMGGAPVFPTIDDLLALLQVFVGIVKGSLKKSEASVAVSPVAVGSFLSG